MSDGFVTVCGHCFRASCWHMEFPCDEYREAGTCRLTVTEILLLNAEHVSHWACRIEPC